MDGKLETGCNMYTSLVSSRHRNLVVVIVCLFVSSWYRKKYTYIHFAIKQTYEHIWKPIMCSIYALFRAFERTYTHDNSKIKEPNRQKNKIITVHTNVFCSLLKTPIAISSGVTLNNHDRASVHFIYNSRGQLNITEGHLWST